MDRFETPRMIAFITNAAQAINVLPTVNAAYKKFLCDEMMPPSPSAPLIPDGQIGGGTPRSRNWRPGHLRPFQFPITGRLNTHIAARFGSRLLGGEVSSQAVTAAASYDVTTLTRRLDDEGRVPPFSGIGFLIGGYDYVLSLAMNSMEISFDGDRNVDYSCQVFGGGFRREISNNPGIIPATIDASELDEYHTMVPAGTRVTWYDGQTVNFGTDANILSGACSYGNNIVAMPLPEDPFLDPADWYSGAYPRDIHITDQDPMARLDIAMTQDFAGYTLAQAKNPVTNLTYLFRSADLIGVTPERFEFEWKYPVARCIAAETGTKGKLATVGLQFYGEPDATDGLLIQRVRTNLATIS
jgi:hypothetical protein